MHDASKKGLGCTGTTVSNLGAFVLYRKHERLPFFFATRKEDVTENFQVHILPTFRERYLSSALNLTKY